MPLKREYDGDALKAPGAFLAVSRDRSTGDFIGFYAFTQEGTYIRAHRMWITATGQALYQLSGSQIVKMDPAFIDAFDDLDEKGAIPSVEEIAAGSSNGGSGLPGTSEPSPNDVAGVSPTTIRRAWRLASRIVASRPWLEASWVGLSDVPFHLVVHDGPSGAALHFGDGGPTWEPGSAPEQVIEWDDVDDVEAPNPTGAVDWVGSWGPPALSMDLTAKAAAYTLIAHLLDRESNDERWAVRPARLIHYTDESADAPDSALSLTTAFPSLAPTVQWYVDQITSPSWGEGTIWHEPLWLITRDEHPRLVVDEAGQVHLTYDSLTEVLGARAVAADLGGIEDLHSFDLLDALPRVSGDFTKLVALLCDGPAATLAVVKPLLTPPAEVKEDRPGTELSPVEGPRSGSKDPWETRREGTPVTWESKVRGLLLGLALGDANATDLTATPPQTILRAGAATQMAAWTTDGMLRCTTRYGVIQTGEAPWYFIESSYRRWGALRGLRIPPAGYPEEHGGWLIEVPAMAERRGHSSSMDQAMETRQPSDRDTCRPMIRALPVAAFAGADRFSHCDARQAGVLARGVAAITHRNPAVCDAADMAARIAVHCLRDHGSFKDVFEVAASVVPIPPSLVKALLEARKGASEHPADPEFLRQVAPDDTSASVLAGAVYTACSVPVWKTAAHAMEFARLAPDSDGVAGLVGAFLGALHGYEVFPTAQMARLELGWVMDRLAIDIALEVKDNLLPLGGVKEGAEPWLDPWWKVKYPQG